MNATDKQGMFQQAAEIMRLNDRGDYTVPTSGLYPFQWNWDSCLVALGQRHVDEKRAWTELETLFKHQWDDGMVPHIVFHELDDGYFPGPDVWNTGRKTPTTGITQPPVAGFAVKRLFDLAKDKELANKKAKALIAHIDRWHEWFYRCRDPQQTGLVALIHPWEAAALAELLGESEIAKRNRGFATHALTALEALWSKELGQYICFDRFSDKLIDSPSVGGLIPVVAAIPEARANAIANRIEELGTRCRYLVPSHDPADSRFDAKRYWRGPSWLIVNYLIADGLHQAGLDDVAGKIEEQSLQLINQSGFAEYYDPVTGEPCGGKTFSWTAAMVMEFLQKVA